MEITQVKIFPVQEDKLKAFVSVVFDQCFMVNDIKVIQGKDGLFLSMPSRRKKSGEFKDVAHPLNNEMRRRLEVSVLAEYRALVDDPTPRRPDREPVAVEASAAASGFPSPAPAPATRPVEKPAAESAALPNVEPAEPAKPAALVEKRPVPVENADSAPEGDDEEGQKTLEEVQEIHLRDSFWNVS